MSEDKPPYVQFEIRPIEDRDASIAAGRFVAKDVVFALVTPAGTRERVERPADDWIAYVREGVKQERIPSNWLPAFEDALERFKKNQEQPEFGTSIKNYPALSPAQVRMLLDIGIVTVEQLAECTEEALQRIGMGARAMKERARTYLEAAKGAGVTAAEHEALVAENEALKVRNEALEQRMEKLEALTAHLGTSVPVTEQVVEEDSIDAEVED